MSEDSSSTIPPSPDTLDLTSGALLARNTLLNFLGLASPIVLAVIAIPVLLSALGTDRFGVLTLIWMVIGYFSIFDLGLSRALTQLVAEKSAAGRRSEIAGLVWTALLIVLVLGSSAGVLLVLVTPWLVGSGLQIPPALQSETRVVFFLLAFTLPWVVSTAALRGVLEAEQRFDIVSALRIPLGVLSYGGPLLVLPFSTSLVAVVAVLIVGRIVAWLAHLVLCLRVVESLRRGFSIHLNSAAHLVRRGGWMTVSNLISPLMMYFDRFLIGALVSVTAVAYYVTPYEVLARFWLIPAALIGVLFPAFAASYASNPARTTVLFDRGVRAVFLLLFPVVLLSVTFAYEGLNLWLGQEFAANSTRVMQLLAVGVLVNGLGQVAITAIQGVGRPDLAGKLHLIELPLYLVMLWWLLSAYGIVGAAVAWTLRMGVDATALFLMARRFLPVGATVVYRTSLMMTATITMLAVGAVLSAPVIKLVYAIVALSVFGVLAWGVLLAPVERSYIRAALQNWRDRPALS